MAFAVDRYQQLAERVVRDFQTAEGANDTTALGALRRGDQNGPEQAGSMRTCAKQAGYTTAVQEGLAVEKVPFLRGRRAVLAPNVLARPVHVPFAAIR